MTRKQFKDLMKTFINIRKAEDKLNMAFQEVDPDFKGKRWGFSQYETIFIRAMECALGDNAQWLSYWVYDCDLGKDPLSKRAVDWNGKKIKFVTLDHVYTVIKKDKAR